MNIIPFSKIETEKLKLILFFARLGFCISVIFTFFVLCFSFYDMFYVMTSGSWSEESGYIVRRGRGIMAFSNYWRAFIAGVIITLLSCVVAAIVSIDTKLNQTNA